VLLQKHTILLRTAFLSSPSDWRQGRKVVIKRDGTRRRIQFPQLQSASWYSIASPIIAIAITQSTMNPARQCPNPQHLARNPSYAKLPKLQTQNPINPFSKPKFAQEHRPTRSPHHQKYCHPLPKSRVESQQSWYTDLQPSSPFVLPSLLPPH
jgi:hypothetical protein